MSDIFLMLFALLAILKSELVKTLKGSSTAAENSHGLPLDLPYKHTQFRTALKPVLRLSTRLSPGPCTKKIAKHMI
jgi:hypothetical protein